MTNLKHVMIDLATMATTPDSAIIAIGAVQFDPRLNKMGEEFYIELDWKDQGRRICPETQAWWSRQSDLAKKALEGFEYLDMSLAALEEFLPSDVKVWGNGPTFDISILENAYTQHNMQIPWKFWNIRCCRTVLDLYESRRGGLNRKAGGGTHNALGDAKFQAKLVNKMWGDLDHGVL